MAFIKQTITDRVVVGGQRYTMTTLGDGRVEIVPSPDSVIEAGTPINKDLLQRYEDFLEEVQNHLDNTSNPHGVTKAQVGLGNVPNIDATNASNISSGTLNVNRLPSGIPQANISGLVAALDAMNTHMDNTSNPHGVTKAQVGLGNVTNDAQLKASDKVTSIGSSPTNNQIPSALAVKNYADTKLAAGDLIGAISTVLTTNLTPNRVLISNDAGKISTGIITSTELSRLSGLNQNINTALAGKLSNGSLIGSFTNNSTINKSILTTYKFLMFELKKLEGSYDGDFYGDAVIVTPDIFYYYHKDAGPNIWATGPIPPSGTPFVLDLELPSYSTPSLFASYLNSNYPASGYPLGEYARNKVNASTYVYALVALEPPITQKGGIRLAQFDGTNLTYATVVSISNTQIKLNCNSSYHLRIWGFN